MENWKSIISSRKRNSGSMWQSANKWQSANVVKVEAK